MKSTELPESISLALQHAKSALLAHSQWHLDPIERFRVYQAMIVAETGVINLGPHYESASPFQLAFVASEYVLPIWGEKWPNDRLPHLLLDYSLSAWKPKGDTDEMSHVYGESEICYLI